MLEGEVCIFNTDKPINHISEDKLGRSSFARQLAIAIVNFSTNDNLVISLQGKWGSGKTSVLNMAIEEIELLKNNKNDILIVRFNPWNFTDSSQLIDQFFLTLVNTLKIDNPDEKIKNLGTVIKEYSTALEYSEYIPVVGKYLKLIPKLLSTFGNTVKEKADKRLNDVSYRKRKVEKTLIDLNIRILIVIDDIDRLSNEQIRLIFQLVNAVAGFPNITYLLSYDKDIVSRALGEIQGCKGEEYLEKIIQVPFDIPPLNISKLYEILYNNFADLLGSPNAIKNDIDRLRKVFNSCIKPFINTLRDVNRYCNVLSFAYAAVKAETDFIDLAGIIALSIFAPSIFEWIRENKSSLIGGHRGGGVILYEINKQKEEMLQRFHDIYPEDPNIMINAIASLFPIFSSKVMYPTDVTSDNELNQAMRIAAKDRFDLYFLLSLENIKISRREVDESLLKWKNWI